MDGGQLRDFIWVGDCIDIVNWLLDTPSVSGLFNCGTGKARSFADLAAAVYRALGKEPNIEFVDTPEDIRERYQYFTEATMDRLRGAGYEKPMTELEDGVRSLCRRFSAHGRPVPLGDGARMYFAIPLPQIDPVLFSIGPFAVRWYALSYVAGLVLGWQLLRRRAAVSTDDLSADNIDDFLVWATIGIILGGGSVTSFFIIFNTSSQTHQRFSLPGGAACRSTVVCLG